MGMAQLPEFSRSTHGTEKAPRSYWKRQKPRFGRISDETFIQVVDSILTKVGKTLGPASYQSRLSPFIDTRDMEFPRLSRTHSGPEAQRLERVSVLLQDAKTRPLTKPEILELKKIG